MSELTGGKVQTRAKEKKEIKQYNNRNDDDNSVDPDLARVQKSQKTGDATMKVGSVRFRSHRKKVEITTSIRINNFICRVFRHCANAVLDGRRKRKAWYQHAQTPLLFPR